ncbi:hypothetical protein F4693_002201 [Sphingomonas endophytica]|uniref:Efflux system membrane protein n=1 Tax=Sphingomonas endophytica TaxID=869719 RepID=A0A7X0JCQ4_9SPHN|nr:DUF1656 domain-containing protein [Sphingomonas endophytica]MBB6505214.1 hypothetical protein [Sphingomonas endophytica]
MLSEVSIAGIYLPPLLLYLAATLPLFAGLRVLLTRAGVLRFVWHPALFELAILLALVALLILFV